MTNSVSPTPDPPGLAADLLGLERTVLEARRRLASIRSAGGHSAAEVPRGPDSPDEQRVTARVTAADGRIAVTALHGRIQRVELDPRVLRLEPGELAARFERSLNAALADLRSAAPADEWQSPVDLRAVAHELDRVRSEATRQMREIGGGIADAVAQLRCGTHLPGYVEVLDLDGLLADLARVLSPIAASTERQDRGDEPEQTQGTGETADGLVCAIVVPGGRVSSLRIDARAVRAGSHDLADQVTVAVNAALDDLSRRQPPAGVRPGALDHAVDRAELSRRLQEIQDRGLDQLRALGSSVSVLMDSIRHTDR